MALYYTALICKNKVLSIALGQEPFACSCKNTKVIHLRIDICSYPNRSQHAHNKLDQSAKPPLTLSPNIELIGIISNCREWDYPTRNTNGLLISSIRINLWIRNLRLCLKNVCGLSIGCIVWMVDVWLVESNLYRYINSPPNGTFLLMTYFAINVLKGMTLRWIVKVTNNTELKRWFLTFQDC